MANDIKMVQSNEDTKQHDQDNTTEDQHDCQPITKRSTEYSTENYKIELNNLPRKVNFHVIKNLLERNFKLTPHKIKIGQGKAFITFKNEQERDTAIQTLDNQDWKGRTLNAQLARPANDLAAKKRKIMDDSEACQDQSKDPETDIPSDATINNRVCPLWNVEYVRQIEHKDKSMRKVLKTIEKTIDQSIKQDFSNLNNDNTKLSEWSKQDDKVLSQYAGVLHSPVLNAYRNKCEFNVGHNGEVGFMMGRYKNGLDRVCRPPKDCPILCQKMYDILDKFRSYLSEKSPLRGFDLVTHNGNYRQLTIRRNQKEEYLIIIDLHPQSLSKEELDGEINNVIDELKSIQGVVSIFFNIAERSSFSSANQSLRHVFGEQYLVELLQVSPERPLKFRIGPASFFQVNTKAAELLYRDIIDLAQLDRKSFVLDVGCGTGTIGLSLAHKVNHVIGIEIVAQAIEDAKANAKENNIENVSFYAGKAEELIGEALKIMRNKMEFQNLTDGEIVAIVDPPRVGFNNSFIKTLRASNIKKLIYVACDPEANTNLLTLCRPKSKSYQGEFFVPVRAKAFDLFPHTKFSELVLVYKRFSLVVNP